ncbi:amidohydrolase family protein [Nocardia sp. NPDC050713]|uniref:amidohydrolase family protein n=1 Tax=Nocardia sp. NPDC050713 TaxID=3154511 RepID=UPI0033CC7CDE
MLTDDVTLTDHHCHGVTAADLDRPGFEALLGEGPRGSFDSALGLAVRRWCAPVLDLPPHTGADAYLARRVDLGWREVAARLLGAAGTARWLVDTGLPGGLTDLPEFGALAGGEVGEIVRLEQVAEQVIAEVGGTAKVFDRIEAAVRERAVGAVGLKTVVAYRVGLDFPLTSTPPPTLAPEHRLTDPATLGWLVGLGARLGAELGLPLQIHTGFGDPDLRLHRADPLLLTDFLHANTGLTVVLLHCWPFHRNAAYLSHVFEHVHMDLGLAIPHVGRGARAVLGEALELAPFRSLLYSSDGYGLPELHYLGAALWREALGRLVDEWLGDDVITIADAEALVSGLAHGNAERIYPSSDTSRKPKPR